LTLASICVDATQYDRRVSSPRLVVVPMLLFAAVSGGVFALAKLHLARPGFPHAATGQKIALGDFYNGQTVFSQKCAACHGQAGKGGGIGPKLAGVPIPLTAAKAMIDAGGGVMPAALVTGKAERDVLAYLATILSSGP
jgi:mono/diheme cytochrome c family protein